MIPLRVIVVAILATFVGQCQGQIIVLNVGDGESNNNRNTFKKNRHFFPDKPISTTPIKFPSHLQQVNKAK